MNATPKEHSPITAVVDALRFQSAPVRAVHWPAKPAHRVAALAELRAEGGVA